jgi:hypothetical protein
MIATGVVEVPVYGGAVAIVDDRADVLGLVHGRSWFQDDRGYLVASVRGKTLKLHREVWRIANGSAPAQLDHVNRIRFDNRLANLRPANGSLNLRNRGKWRGSLPMGVEPAGVGKYRARISVCDEMVALGTFPAVDDAAAVYRLAADRLLRIEAARAAVGLAFAEDGMPPPPRTAERSAWLARWRSVLTAPDAPNEYADLPLFRNPLEIHG